MSSLPADNLDIPLTKSYSKPPPSFTPHDDTPNIPLDPSKDARQIVRMGQCPPCSYVLKEPVTLPCGNTLCKACIPETHVRRNISYPATANRLHGFRCPFATCRQEHAAGDCSANVALNKVLNLVRTEMQRVNDAAESSSIILQVEEIGKRSAAGNTALRDDVVHVRSSIGGKLAATFAMADVGELDYDVEVKYTHISPKEAIEDKDAAILERLKDLTRSELDCQVCYGLFLDPITLTCGHTFCRKCVHRVLDHSHLCPVCRRQLALSPSLTKEAAPSNKLLSKIISAFCPEALAARASAIETEEKEIMGELDTALFICTLSFPSMPTFLHIFEPRYRLMIRRAVESDDRKFGMLLHNASRSIQGELGRVPFYQYGTLLHIESMQLMPDGRSLIETVGVSRFRVLSHGMLDGYTVGKIERIDDISLAAEEALEAAETTPTLPARNLFVADHFGAPPHHYLPTTPSSQESTNAMPSSPTMPAASSMKTDIDRIPTQELLNICVRFVQKMQSQSAPWLHSRVYQAYGACPVDDPKLFPWWFASVLPTADEERYRLLGTTSVRERLKICVGWVRVLEAGTRWSPSTCTVG